MRIPWAEWRGPIPNQTLGGMESPVVGVVEHIMGASMAAADAWFHNPNAKASAHFGIANDGHLVQWVDTADRAWHAVAANRHWIGVETEGSGGPLTDAQVQTFGRLYKDLEAAYHFGFAITDDPANGRGLGWHGMGGQAWGGHGYCPGEARKAQRSAILAVAQGQQPTPTPQPQPPQHAPDGNPHTPLVVDGAFGPATVRALQWSLNHTGASPQLVVDGDFGPASKKAMQRRLGVSADGSVGPATVKALQRHVGSPADGQWGPDTTRHLQAVLNRAGF